MEQILTVSILSYFMDVHNRNIKTSNALDLKGILEEFLYIHAKSKACYKVYNGMSFESIHEYLEQEIHRIDKSHKLYVSKGYLLTNNTKQYTIEQRLSSDLKSVVKEVVNAIEQPIAEKIEENDSKSIKQISLKYALIRKKKHKSR